MKPSLETLHDEDRLIARDGLSLYEQWWLPETDPRAAVILVHGIMEHSGRHAATAEDLCRQCYAVYAADLRGHGRSGGPRCFVRTLDRYLDDLDVLADDVRRRQPGKPLFLFGHSLGGLIAVQWCVTRDPDLRGLVLSAPAIRLQADLFPILRHLAALGAMLFPHLGTVRLGGGNISRDPAVVARFRADPLVFHGRLPVGTAAAVLRGIRQAGRRLDAIRLPLMVLHGTADHVCSPSGSRDLCRLAASEDKVLHLYEGFYHEVLSEPERNAVVADMVAWLGQRS
jgi:alpha-beta hydrolase superfamily lysophospholipase